VFNNILSGDVKFSPQISTDLKSLITELIYKDKNKRLKLVEAIKAHPFFNGVNWSDVAEKTTDPPFKPEPTSGFDTFEAVPTLVANLKKGKFHGFTFVEPEHLFFDLHFIDIHVDQNGSVFILLIVVQIFNTEAVSETFLGKSFQFLTLISKSFIYLRIV
jgi:serine/threonine protein kinase